MNVFSFNPWDSITALWFGFGFSIMLGGVFGLVMKILFDFTVRYFPKNLWKGGD